MYSPSIEAVCGKSAHASLTLHIRIVVFADVYKLCSYIVPTFLLVAGESFMYTIHDIVLLSSLIPSSRESLQI